MTIEEIKQNIFDSEQFVIDELKRIQTLYELKRVIRYNHSRTEEIHTESVAEHIFGMHCLIDYFLPLEDGENRWSELRIRTMAQYHDIDEIITGDVIGYFKSDKARLNERFESEKVLSSLPYIMQSKLMILVDEYEAQQTPEARFVKAIDKIEPSFHLYNETGKQTTTTLKTTQAQHDSVKLPYMHDFPVIKRFAEVTSKQFKAEGFFHE